jgi:hypothetical protein
VPIPSFCSERPSFPGIFAESHTLEFYVTVWGKRTTSRCVGPVVMPRQGPRARPVALSGGASGSGQTTPPNRPSRTAWPDSRPAPLRDRCCDPWRRRWRSRPRSADALGRSCVLRIKRPDAACGFHPVDVGHVDIHEHQVEALAVPLGELVAGPGDGLDARVSSRALPAPSPPVPWFGISQKKSTIPRAT